LEFFSNFKVDGREEGNNWSMVFRFIDKEGEKESFENDDSVIIHRRGRFFMTRL